MKTWEKDKNIADVVFDETVDYLTIRELIKNDDDFYHDPLNNYIPLLSAIIIANMYAKRLILIMWRDIFTYKGMD